MIPVMGKSDTELYEFIGAKIKELRENYGGTVLSQEQLASKIETQSNTISRWENATYKPKVEDLGKLANFFGVPISVFFPNMTDVKPELQALLSATADLHKDDIEELTNFAMYRKARTKLKEKKK